MSELFFCTVSAVNEAAGTADVAIPERESVVKTDVPILDTVYRLPKAGEIVAALFSVSGGRIGRGVILGCPYRPKEIMEVSASVLKAKEIRAERVIYTDICERG